MNFDVIVLSPYVVHTVRHVVDEDNDDDADAECRMQMETELGLVMEIYFNVFGICCSMLYCIASHTAYCINSAGECVECACIMYTQFE